MGCTLRLDARDEAIRDAADLYSGVPPSTAAKALARDLSRYLSTARRHQRDRDAPPPEMNPMQAALYEVATLNRGETLGWRQILNVLSGLRRA